MFSDKLVYSRYFMPSENSIELSIDHCWINVTTGEPAHLRSIVYYIIKKFTNCYNYRNIKVDTASIRCNTS